MTGNTQKDDLPDQELPGENPRETVLLGKNLPEDIQIMIMMIIHLPEVLPEKDGLRGRGLRENLPGKEEEIIRFQEMLV